MILFFSAIRPTVYIEKKLHHTFFILKRAILSEIKRDFNFQVCMIRRILCTFLFFLNFKFFLKLFYLLAIFFP